MNMDFATIEKLIDDVVEFIKNFAANLRKFIGGFKGELEFTTPEA